MNYKAQVLNLLLNFPTLKPRQIIKLNRYFVEYARELAEAVGIDTIKEYKRTSKLIEKYRAKWYDCIWTVWTILDVYDQIAKTQTQYEDSDTMIEHMVTPEEREELKCLADLLQQPN